ncbi:hypothetical protein WG909_09935 [Peptostreptococcaceae bacterium AGR-M142]|jgi:hypothetical protein|nr:hypothetical protein [Peptostreptococcaceae bacterium]
MFKKIKSFFSKKKFLGDEAVLLQDIQFMKKSKFSKKTQTITIRKGRKVRVKGNKMIIDKHIIDKTGVKYKILKKNFKTKK